MFLSLSLSVLILGIIGLLDFSRIVNFTNSVWCEIQVGGSGVKRSQLIIGVVYRSPNSSPANDQLLFDIINIVSNHDTIIMGDFNYPDISWEDGVSGAKGRAFHGLMHDTFLHQHVLFPTRGDNILDLVISSDPDIIRDVTGLGKIGCSDHEVIGFDIVVKHVASKSTEVVPNFRKADIDGITDYLRSIDWGISFLGLSASECWGYFLKVVCHIGDNFIPTRRRQSKQRRPAWMTTSILREIRSKRKLWRLYKANKSSEVFSRFQDKVKSVRRLISSAKFAFEKDLANNVKDNPKAFYGYVRSKQKVKDVVGPLRNSDTDALVSDNQGMAVVLNDFFASVFQDVDRTIDLEGLTVPNCLFSVESVTFSAAIVEERLNNLGLYKSAGPDNVHPFLLRTFSHFFAAPLSMIFQYSLDEGDIPADWKSANVTPIFKKGDRSKAGNYRPVSLTSVACKIMESIIKDTMVKFLDTHSLIKDSQHGFRKGRSCLTNLLEFLEDVTRSVDDDIAVDVVFLDFQKAFDKVPHKRLLLKLEGLGIRGSLLGWISDWLSDRRQRVVIGGSGSSWKNVTSGVPQGSVLGPLLFVAYINDLDDAVSISGIKKFADDTKVYREVCSELDAISFQSELDSIFDWSRDWGMFFNVDKCKVMHVGSRNKKIVYNVNGRDLSVVQTEKDLH